MSITIYATRKNIVKKMSMNIKPTLLCRVHNQESRETRQKTLDCKCCILIREQRCFHPPLSSGAPYEGSWLVCFSCFNAVIRCLLVYLLLFFQKQYFISLMLCSGFRLKYLRVHKISDVIYIII